MKTFFASLGLLLLMVAPCFAQDELKPETRIISQPAAPVKITSYAATYAPGGNRFIEQGVHHRLEYESISTKPIVAIQFGLVSFDVWNEFLDKLNGVTLKTLSASGKDKSEWIASRFNGFTFHTGVAYVNRVRFSDGEIWNADLTIVVAELKKIQKDFDAASLKQKPETEKP